MIFLSKDGYQLKASTIKPYSLSVTVPTAVSSPARNATPPTILLSK